MTKQTLEALNEVSTEAVSELKKYFSAADDDKGKKADRALMLIGRINGMESNRLKDLALQLQIAKAVGVRGEALRPLLIELNPASYSVAAPEQKALASE